MIAHEFFHTEAVAALLRRVHLAAGAPVAIHAVMEGSEIALITGCGTCPVCAFYRGNSKLHKTCMDGLRGALVHAAKRKRLVPFICPMGFSCISIGVDVEAGLVMTVGPYCPDDAEESLLPDLKRGLMRIGLDPTPAENLVRKVHRAPSSCVPEITLWAVDDLLNLFRQRGTSDQDFVDDIDGSVGEQVAVSRRCRRRLRHTVSFGQAVAVALACGDQIHYRHLILLRLSSEIKGDDNPPAEFLRSRVLVLLGEVIAEVSATNLFGEMNRNVSYRELADLDQIRTIEDVRDFFKRFWAVLPHLSSVNTEMRNLVKRLHKLLVEDIIQYGSLKDAACALGVHPSTLSGKFKQTFGVFFTDYVNRLRVEKAKALLALESLSMEEVARRVGLANSGTLNRLFRDLEGFRPSYFRRFV